MMILLNLIDVAPDPVGMGIVAVVVLFVIGFVVLLMGALVLFLWLRKRGKRHEVMPFTVDLQAQNDVRSDGIR